AADELLEFDVTVHTSSIPALSGTGETITVTADVETISADPVPDDDTAATEFHVSPGAHLSLHGVDGGNGIGIVGGQPITVTYAVMNNGPDSADGMALDVTLPDGLQLVSADGCVASGDTGEI